MCTSCNNENGKNYSFVIYDLREDFEKWFIRFISIYSDIVPFKEQYHDVLNILLIIIHYLYIYKKGSKGIEI